LISWEATDEWIEKSQRIKKDNSKRIIWNDWISN
jgi:hypothetical protein